MTGEVSAPPLLVIGMEVRARSGAQRARRRGRAGGRARAAQRANGVAKAGGHAARRAVTPREQRTRGRTPFALRPPSLAHPPRTRLCARARARLQGLWGTVLCTCILYPLAWLIPGEDHGHIEDPFNTYAMVSNSGTIQYILVWYFVFIFLYNSFGVLVTYLLNSVWHAILDNFRPITVWGADLFIFYAISHGTFGERWTIWSYLELGGLAILLLGTAVYNASVRVPGVLYDPASAMMATPLMARSPLISSALDHARAQGFPDELREKVVTQYVAPQALSTSQYGFITVET